MCICFFDDGPIDKDPRANRGNMFKVGMKDAPCKDPAICCAGFLCNPCVGCYMRKKVPVSYTHLTLPTTPYV